MAESGSQTSRDNGEIGEDKEQPGLTEIMMAIEKGKQQVKENQVQIMMTQAKILEQIATTSTKPKVIQKTEELGKQQGTKDIRKAGLRKGSSHRTIKCYKCGRGHLRKDCPLRNAICYYCGDPDHLRNKCARKHLPMEVARAQA